jgi:glutathione peroxidase-family protein
MKLLLILLLSLSAFASDLYNYSVEKADGKIDLKEFKDKSVLVVNIATRCGYTGQLDGLEKLYKKYKEKGFTVIGVPSNDFGGQTPEGNKEVVKFCRLKYGASFPISAKQVVTGDKKHPLYKYLTGLTENEEIGWNFTKFLFDKKGKLVKRFSSSVSPSDETLIKAIESSI